MNRVIKFRGFDKDNDCWRYGFYTKLIEGARVFHAIIAEDENKECRLTRYYIHNYESISQFTGLLDRNGTEVYCADILSYQSLKKPYNLIEFYNGAFGYFCFKGEGFEYFVPIFETYKSADCWKIIGNIHQDKHLLEANK